MDERQVVVLSGKRGAGRGRSSLVSVILRVSAGVMRVHLVCFMAYK